MYKKIVSMLIVMAFFVGGIMSLTNPAIAETPILDFESFESPTGLGNWSLIAAGTIPVIYTGDNHSGSQCVRITQSGGTTGKIAFLDFGGGKARVFVSAWIKNLGDGGQFMNIRTNNTGVASPNIQSLIEHNEPSHLGTTQHLTTGGTYDALPFFCPKDVWFHIGMLVDDTTNTVYVFYNGTLSYKRAFSTTYSVNEVSFGIGTNRWSSASKTVDFLIDDVRIYTGTSFRDALMWSGGIKSGNDLDMVFIGDSLGGHPTAYSNHELKTESDDAPSTQHQSVPFYLTQRNFTVADNYEGGETKRRDS